MFLDATRNWLRFFAFACSVDAAEAKAASRLRSKATPVPVNNRTVWININWHNVFFDRHCIFKIARPFNELLKTSHEKVDNLKLGLPFSFENAWQSASVSN